MFCGRGRRHCGKCGGSILAKNWIITAGHCCKDIAGLDREPGRMSVAVGAHHDDSCRYSNTCDVSPKINPNFIGTILKVRDVFTHDDYEAYDPDTNKRYIWDMCLLKVQKIPINSNTISAISLSPIHVGDVQKNGNFQAECFAVGWGVTESGWQSRILLETKINVINTGVCTNSTSEAYRSFDQKYNFCAGTTFGHDTCTGDSGGPLICLVNGVQVLYGIISFGPKDGTGPHARPLCGNKDGNSPGVYATVTNALDWIKSYVPGKKIKYILDIFINQMMEFL